MSNKMTFVETLPLPSPINPVKITLNRVSAYEVEIRAEDSEGTVSVAGIRSDGTLVRYIWQEKQLLRLGFQTESGIVKLYN
jgi:hypothetical protein